MRFKFLIFSLFFINFSFAQVLNDYTSIDKKIDVIPDSSSATTSGIAAYINSNFKTENEKIRAAFYWTSKNISYDVANMYEPNFTDSSQEKIIKTLKSRKGVCIHFAEVFNDIASKIGIKTYIILGYTKQNGKIATISHAWCASKIDGKWFLFDPTWSAGYVLNNKYFKKLNNAYYKVEPSKMILSHMPFDYLWQFLSVPRTNQEFYSGKIEQSKTKVTYDYATEIDKYNELSDGDKAFDCAQRVEKNGLVNNLIVDYYNSKKNEFTVIRQNNNVEKINQIVTNYNQAVGLLNDFIMYRNKSFKPTISDAAIKEMIQTPLDKLVKCKNEIYAIGSVGSENTASLNGLKRSILDAVEQAEKQSEFVKEYLSKGNGARKGMFKKVSWLGIPLR
ncbi:MAG: hypothetical protein K2P85_04845 [Flavobacteriaceae bacterium]|nr:hypothetical protein [Flavobacteriaceae bacterium]